MATHILPRTGNAPLKFDGELIAESRPAQDPDKRGKDPKRWHELALYRTAGGQFVVTITYQVDWKGENSHYHAEVAPDVSSAVKVIREYNPIAHVIGYPLGEHYAEKQARLLAALRQQYAVQVSELLNRDEFAEVVS